MAKEVGFEVQEGEFWQEDVEQSYECFMTNAVEELVAIREIGNVRFAGNEGPVYNRLYNASIPHAPRGAVNKIETTATVNTNSPQDNPMDKGMAPIDACTVAFGV